MATQQRKRKSTALKTSMSVFFFPTVSHNIQPEGISWLYILSTAQPYSAYKTLGRNYCRETPQSFRAYRSQKAYTSLPRGFLICKRGFSHHHTAQAIRCRINGPSPSCCYSWEQDLGSAHVTVQDEAPRQGITPVQLSCIKEPHILCNSEEK